MISILDVVAVENPQVTCFILFGTVLFCDSVAPVLKVRRRIVSVQASLAQSHSDALKDQVDKVKFSS